MAEQWVITKLDELTKAHAALETNFFERVQEYAQHFLMLSNRIAALEPPATPAPDPACALPPDEPGFDVFSCELCIDGTYWNDTHKRQLKCGYCGGTGWRKKRKRVTTAEPDPAPLDPDVMTAIRKWGTAMHKHGYQDGQGKRAIYEKRLADEAYDEMESAIRSAYGRDGAR